jgi:tetratricopeptide (TPR) repeat protein
MAISEEKVGKPGVSDALADFIQNNRKGLLITCGVIIVAVLGFIAGFTIRDILRGKALSRVEDFTQRYETLVMDINEASKEADVQALLDELNAFAVKHSGYAGARAYYLAASIYVEKKDWEQAETAWTKSARAAAKSYLAPVSLFNAAVAAEEQGNPDQAISHYSESVSQDANFPGAARAQFAIGRLYEAQGNTQAALEAYRIIPEKWESETIWINLAQSRIIGLGNSGL